MKWSSSFRYTFAESWLVLHPFLSPVPPQSFAKIVCKSHITSSSSTNRLLYTFSSASIGMLSKNFLMSK